MSYILEALKKSQQERELGHVPRLQAVTFDEQPAHVGTHRWVYAALLLALVAMVIALYAVLRTGQPPDQPPTQPPALTDSVALTLETESTSSAAPPSMTGAKPPASVEAAESVDPPALASRLSETGQTPVSTDPIMPPPARPRTLPQPTAALPAPEINAAPERRPVPRSMTGLSGPESLSVQPEVLVVPAPPKPGQPLPRGAEELRRAVLGEGAAPSVEVSTMPAQPPEPRPEPPPSDNAPIPKDLIADIEAFKRQVTSGASEPSAQRKPPKPPTARKPVQKSDESGLPPPASLTLRSKLPPFDMSVHIYDVDPARRFVYVNGRKLREREQSREGIKLERVVADGAVLSYDGERFFQSR